MFIRAVTTSETVRKGFMKETLQRTSTFGKVADKHICVDTWKDSAGVLLKKRIVLWNNSMQKIVNKFRNDKGKFDRIG